MSGRKLQYPTKLPGWKGISFLPNNKGVRKEASWFDFAKVNRIFEFLTYLKNNRHPTIVSILDCRRISNEEYSYDMPLMAELSRSEALLVELYSVGMDHDGYRNFHRNKVSRLGKKHPKLIQVLKKINSWDRYADLHEGNIMRDQYGNYKLLDIEGFSFSKYSAQEIIDKIY